MSRPATLLGHYPVKIASASSLPGRKGYHSPSVIVATLRRFGKTILPHFAQRGIYLTFGDTCVINLIRKAELCHQMCPKRLPEEHQTNVPFVRRRQLWRVGPSTRGATAPQGAQQVNFVVGRCASLRNIESTTLPVMNWF